MKQLRDLIGRVRRTPVTVGDDAVDAMAYFDSGIEEAGSGRHRRAVELFTKAIESSPAAAAGMYQHRGRAYADMGMHHEAIADYDAAVRLQPGCADFYLDRGNSHHEMGEHDRASKDYDEAIRLRPDFAAAYANRAAVHVELGAEDAGAADEERARELGIDGEALEGLLAEARNKAEK